MDYMKTRRPNTTGSRRVRGCAIALGLVVAGAALAPVAGQEAGTMLVGGVVDAASHPIAGAIVRMVGQPASMVTGDDGAFEVGPVGPGEHVLVIEKEGFDPRGFRFRLNDDSMEEITFGAVALTPRIPTLPAIVIETEANKPHMAGFYRRRARGFGLFFTRREIRARNVSRLSDLFRGLPGFTVDCSGAGCHPRLTRAQGSTRFRGDGGGCEVEYFLDGVPDRLLPDIDLYHPDQVEGIEVYRGPAETPSVYSRTGGHCGVIAIWTA